nr:MAG TPA: hypothetical protein [Caudoviricetes sp.]DAW72140.1 MAG TPA: hypothetical protein [Caudoviricetes sp.]
MSFCSFLCLFKLVTGLLSSAGIANHHCGKND